MGGLTVAALAGSLTGPRVAEASVARAISLGELVYRSRYVVVATSVDAFCRWETIGRRSRIVTYSVMQVHRPLDGRPPDTSELMIRTLGGSVGDRGQIVHGEAVVALDQRAAVFLYDVAPEVYAVTEMAQGHYPVQADVRGVDRLRASISDLELVDTPEAAVHRLDGRSFAETEAVVAQELARGSR